MSRRQAFLERFSFSGDIDLEGNPNGFGRLQTKSSKEDPVADIDWVEGTFESGIPTGKMIVKYQSNPPFSTDGRYEGEVDATFAPLGKGRYEDTSGNEYVGVFTQDIESFWRRSGASVYQRLELQGIHKIPSENYVAEGTFFRGQPHGRVKITFDGMVFNGTFRWHFDDMEISGELKFPDGRVYKGQMAADSARKRPVIDGVGTMIYPDGTARKGSFSKLGELLPDPPLRVEQHWIAFAVPALGLASSLLLMMLVGSFSETMALRTSIVAVAALVGLCFLATIVWRVMINKFNYLVVDGNRIVQHSGIFRRDELELPIDKRLLVEFRRGVLARLIGYGSIYAKHEGGNEIYARWVRNPTQVRDAITARKSH